MKREELKIGDIVKVEYKHQRYERMLFFSHTSEEDETGFGKIVELYEDKCEIKLLTGTFEGETHILKLTNILRLANDGEVKNA